MSSGEADFVQELRSRGTEDAAALLGTVDELNTSILSQGGQPSATTLSLQALFLLKEIPATNNAGVSVALPPTVVANLLTVAKLGVAEVSVALRARMASDSSRVVMGALARVSRMVAAEDELEDKKFNQEVTRTFKAGLDLLACFAEVLFAVTPDKVTQTQLDVLELCWTLAIADRVPVVGGCVTENTQENTVEQRPPLASAVRHKAANQLLATLRRAKTNLRCAAGDFADETKNDADVILQAPLATAAESLLVRNALAEFRRLPKLGGHQNEDHHPNRVQKILLPFLKQAVPWLKRGGQNASALTTALFDLFAGAGVHPLAISALEVLSLFAAPSKKTVFATTVCKTAEAEKERLKVLHQLGEKFLAKPATKVSDPAYCDAYLRCLGVVQIGTLNLSESVRELEGNDLKVFEKMLQEFLEFASSVEIQKSVVVHSTAVLAKVNTRKVWAAVVPVLEQLLSPRYRGAYRSVFLIAAEAFSAFARIKADHYFSDPDFFDASAQQSPETTQKIRELLTAICSIRDDTKQHKVYFAEIDHAVERAVAAFGPRAVLETMPLRILEADLNSPAFETESRSWLLPLLQKGLVYAPLTLFRTDFLPLASKLRERAALCEKKQKLLMARRYSHLVAQVWGLFPGFCRSAVDFGDAIMGDNAKLAKVLSTVLQKEAEYVTRFFPKSCANPISSISTHLSMLRDFCSQALAEMCLSVLSEQSESQQKDAPDSRQNAVVTVTREKALKALSVLAPKVFPELFSAFLQIQKEEGRDASLRARSTALLTEAIKQYTRCIRGESVGKLFAQVAERVLKVGRTLDETVDTIDLKKRNSGFSGNPEAEKKDLDALNLQKSAAEKELGAVTELAAALVPALPVAQLEFALKTFETILLQPSTSIATQRACYRAVRAVFSHGGISEVTGEMLEQFWRILRSSRVLCDPGAYKPRVQALHSFVKLLLADVDEDDDDEEVSLDHGTTRQSPLPAKKRNVQVSSQLVRGFLQEQLGGAGEGIGQDPENMFLVSELLSRSFEHSLQVRTRARDALYYVFYACVCKFDLTTELIAAVGVDLTSGSRSTKAHAVEALAKLLYEQSDQMSRETLDQICEVIVMMLKDPEKMVFRAALNFLKVMCWAVPLSVLKKRVLFCYDPYPAMQEPADDDYDSDDDDALMGDSNIKISKQFFADLLNSPHSAECKLRIRAILEKLVRRICYTAEGEDEEGAVEEEGGAWRFAKIPPGVLPLETLEMAFPFKHRKLLAHVHRQLKRAVRKKQIQQKTSSYADFLKNTEALEKADGTEDGQGDAVAEEDQTASKRKRRRGGEEEQEESGDAFTNLLDAWETAGGEEVNDGFESGNRKKARRLHKDGRDLLKDSKKSTVLGAEGSSIFHAPKGGFWDQVGSGKKMKTYLQDDQGADVMDFADAGAVSHNILSSCQKGANSSHQKNGLFSGTDEGQHGSAEEMGVKFAADGKIVVEEEQTDSEEEAADTKGTTTAYGNNSSSGLGKLAQIRQTRQKKKQHQVRGLEHYAPTKNKARGDVKRKGQTLDPYAYVALNPKLVKEKFKAKSMQSFANVVGKAPERGAKAKRVMNTRMKKAGVKKKGGKAKKSR